MKKLLSLALSLLMFISLMPTMAFAEMNMETTAGTEVNASIIYSDVISITEVSGVSYEHNTNGKIITAKSMYK